MTTRNEVVEIKKWDVRDNLLSYMAKGTELFFDLRGDGNLVSGKIAGVQEKNGKVYFAMTNEPDNFRYRGGKGWYVRKPELSRAEKSKALAERLLDAIADNSADDVAAIMGEAAGLLRVTTN